MAPDHVHHAADRPHHDLGVLEPRGLVADRRAAEHRDDLRAAARPYARSAWVTWMQSSRVGVSTSAWTSRSFGSTYSTIGRPKAAVLPVPVWAWPITSRPSRSGGIACSWIGWDARSRGGRGPEGRLGQAEVGELRHAAFEFRRGQACSQAPLSATGPAAACRSCAGPGGPRGPACVGERVGGAHLGPQLAAGRALEQVASGSSIMSRRPRQCMSRSRSPRGSSASAGPSRPCSARARRSRRPRSARTGRARRQVEHAPTGHLEHDIHLAAVVGLDQRRAEVLGRVHRGIGAEGQAVGASSPCDAVAITRPARTAWPAARPAIPRRPRPKPPPPPPRRSFAEVRNRCQAVRPWISSASARRRRARRAPGRPSTRGRRRTRRSRRSAAAR